MSEWVKNNKVAIGVIIGVTVIATSLFAYMFWYDPSDEITESTDNRKHWRGMYC